MPRLIVAALAAAVLLGPATPPHTPSPRRTPARRSSPRRSHSRCTGRPARDATGDRRGGGRDRSVRRDVAPRGQGRRTPPGEDPDDPDHDALRAGRASSATRRATSPTSSTYFTARGYAVAQHHVRGTGDRRLPRADRRRTRSTTARASSSTSAATRRGRNGDVGMYGISYDAETQISVAGRGDPAKIDVPEGDRARRSRSAASTSTRTWTACRSPARRCCRTPATSRSPAWRPGDGAGRRRTRSSASAASPRSSPAPPTRAGDLTPFWQVREYRPGRAERQGGHAVAPRPAPTGTSSRSRWPASFDRLPATTPHKAIVGVLGARLPGQARRRGSPTGRARTGCRWRPPGTTAT